MFVLAQVLAHRIARLGLLEPSCAAVESRPREHVRLIEVRDESGAIDKIDQQPEVTQADDLVYPYGTQVAPYVRSGQPLKCWQKTHATASWL